MVKFCVFGLFFICFSKACNEGNVISRSKAQDKCENVKGSISFKPEVSGSNRSHTINSWSFPML